MAPSSNGSAAGRGRDYDPPPKAQCLLSPGRARKPQPHRDDRGCRRADVRRPLLDNNLAWKVGWILTQTGGVALMALPCMKAIVGGKRDMVSDAMGKKSDDF